MKRLLSSLVMTLAMLGVMPQAALAANADWSWSDLSSYLSVRDNRPVWAVAHTNAGWYLTDGQNLWNNGQVYRFDGSTSVNVTMDVRNAGMDRVDDIVSDGSDTVIFLQDVVRLDNKFRMVVNKNGTFYNATDIVRGMLDSDEGISQLVGYKGSWRLITTKGRLFGWNGNTSAPYQITLPTAARTIIADERTSDYSNRALYQVNEKLYDFSMSIQPINNGQWIIRLAHDRSVYRGLSSEFTYTWYRVTNDGTFTDISNILPNARQVSLIGSNGKTVLITSKDRTLPDSRESYYGYGEMMTWVHSYDGVSSPTTSSITEKGWKTTSVAWNGTSWMFVQNSKHIYRLVNGRIEYMGEARDYFTSVSGDTNGRFLLGGAASTLGNTNPAFPLTAKLVMVTETGVTTAGSSNTTNAEHEWTDSGTGIRSWEWLSPNVSSLVENGQTTYNVGATDPDGVTRIDVVANGSVLRTCTWNASTENRECSGTLWTGTYPSNTNVFVNAKITDNTGRVTWTKGFSIWNGNATTNGTPANVANTDATSWVWLDPNISSFNQDGYTNFHVSANDPDGINRIVVVVNGTDRKICAYSSAKGNQECAYTLYGSEYSNGSTIYVNARIEDANGNTRWTDSRTLERRAETTTTGTNTSGTVSAWGWFEETDALERNEETVFHGEAWAERGLDKIEVYVNDSLKRTCDFSTAYGNQGCTLTVRGNDYAAGTTLSAKVRATDMNGATVYGSTKTVYVSTSSVTNPPANTPSQQTGEVSAWEWTDKDTTTITLDQTYTYHAGAWAERGIKSVTMYANGAVAYTCSYYSTSGNKDCWIRIDGRSFAVGSTIFVNAKVTDAKGKEAWTTGKTVSIASKAATSANGDAHPSTISVTSNRESGYTSTQLVTLSANATDSDGISRIEIYVNGQRVRICSNSTSCGHTTLPQASDKYLVYSATVVDKLGNVASTEYKQIARMK